MTFYISHSYTLSTVLASCFVTLFLGLFPRVGKDKQALAYCYTGSFIGMSGMSLELYELGLLGVLAYFLTILTKKYFNGYGGRLGSIAFITSSIYYFLGRLL